MSTINCDSCSNLREYAPEFVMNGVTENVAASLKNNTGLNPTLSVVHDNCEDLNAINDCLIGRMPQELPAYDVCDWKEFMEKYIPNQYETLKALIASDCGQWARLAELCEKINSIISPPLINYGVLPYLRPEEQGQYLGVLNPKIEIGPATSFRPWTEGVGISFARMEVSACGSSETEVFEWIAPKLGGSIYCTGIVNGDVIWSADRASFQTATGMSDVLWDVFTKSSWTFKDCMVTDGNRFALLRFMVNEQTQRFEITYVGSTYPDGGFTGYISIGGSNKLYRHIKGDNDPTHIIG